MRHVDLWQQLPPASDRPLGSCAPLHHLLTWFPQSSSASRQPSWSTPSHLQCMQPIRWKQASGLWGRGWEREKETSLIVVPLRLTQHLNPLAVLSQRALKPLFTRRILAVATHSQGEAIEPRKNSIPSVRFAVDCLLIFPLPSFFVFLDSFLSFLLCAGEESCLDWIKKQNKKNYLPSFSLLLTLHWGPSSWVLLSSQQLSAESPCLIWCPRVKPPPPLLTRSHRLPERPSTYATSACRWMANGFACASSTTSR